MSNFTATRAHIYSTGAVIYAVNHNDNENEIFSKHNAAFHATTGHLHTGATGDGPKITSAGLDLTASYAWTGTHTWTQNMVLNGSTSSATFTLKSSTTTGENRYYYKNSNDTFGFETTAGYASGDVNWNLASKTITALAFSHTNSYLKSFIDFGVSTTRKFIWDFPASTTAAYTGDTYTSESSANVLTTVVGGIIANEINCNTAGQTYVYSRTSNTTGEIRNFFRNSDNTKYFEHDYVFTSGDVYWALQSNTKTPLIFSDTHNYIKLTADVAIKATQKLYFDAATGTSALTGNTYDVESSADVLDRVVGGVTALRTTAEGILLPDTDPPTANYINRNSGIKAYIDMDGSGSSSNPYNISSVTTPGTGRYSITWDTNFNSDEYPVHVTPSSTSAGKTAQVYSRTSTGAAVEIRTYDSAGSLSDTAISVSAGGRQ